MTNVDRPACMECVVSGGPTSCLKEAQARCWIYDHGTLSLCKPVFNTLLVGTATGSGLDPCTWITCCGHHPRPTLPALALVPFPTELFRWMWVLAWRACMSSAPPRACASLWAGLMRYLASRDGRINAQWSCLTKAGCTGRAGCDPICIGLSAMRMVRFDRSAYRCWTGYLVLEACLMKTFRAGASHPGRPRRWNSCQPMRALISSESKKLVWCTVDIIFHWARFANRKPSSAADFREQVVDKV